MRLKTRCLIAVFIAFRARSNDVNFSGPKSLAISQGMFPSMYQLCARHIIHAVLTRALYELSVRPSLSISFA
jgi:hypothetical protein